MRPIRRRLVSWVACVSAIAAVGIAMQAALLGSSSYFDAARRQIAALTAVAVALSIPTLGGVLRAWRGGGRFHRVPRRTLAFAAGAALTAIAAVAVGVIARPTEMAVESALASGDVEHARRVVTALRERTAGAPGDRRIDDLDDRVMVAEAARASSADRLRLLDTVASHHRAAAPAAATAARNERLVQVRHLIDARDSKAALAALDVWFARDGAADVAEQRARACDVALEQCAHDACRLGEAMRAQGAHASAARAEKVTLLRNRLRESLVVEQSRVGTPTLSRLQYLRGLANAGAQLLAAQVDDDELRRQAQDAVSSAAAERARVPLLRAERDVVEEVLGGPRAGDITQHIDLHGTYAYLQLDAAHRCVGIYAVGTTAGNRALSSTEWSADRLLSQAVGKQVTVRQPRLGSGTLQWYESGFPVTARWAAGRLLELRIGVATP